MPAGASPKRERGYARLERDFKREHRYPGREAEVAARIVNKQRREMHKTPEARSRQRDDDHALAIRHYAQLTIEQATRRLDGLSRTELQQVRRFESSHRNRKGMLGAIDRKLRGS
jgi:hypothetical protein